MALTHEDELELQYDIPNPEEIMLPADFLEKIKRNKKLLAFVQSCGNKLGVNIRVDLTNGKICIADEKAEFEMMPRIGPEGITHLSEALKSFNKLDGWMIRAAVDGYRGGGFERRWRMLVEVITNTALHLDSFVAQKLGRTISIDATGDIQQLKDSVVELRRMIEKRGKVSKLNLLFNSSLKAIFSQIRVNDLEISSVEDCSFVLQYFELLQKRKYLSTIWNELMVEEGVPSFYDLGDEPERICMQTAPNIERYLSWYKKEYQSLSQSIQNIGIYPEKIIMSSEFESDSTKIEKLLIFITEAVPIYVDIAKCFLMLKRDDSEITHLLFTLTSGDREKSQTCMALVDAVRKKDTTNYEKSHGRILKLYYKYSLKKAGRDF